MYAMTIAFGKAPVMWQLLFKTKETADAAWRNYLTPSDDYHIDLSDDYGQVIRCNIDEVCGAMLEDMNQSKQAHIARALHQQRMQADATAAASADPAIRAAMRGPAVLQPMQGFNGRQ